jgi:hypothetical protein
VYNFADEADAKKKEYDLRETYFANREGPGSNFYHIIVQCNSLDTDRNHCVWLPDAEAIERKIGRTPTEQEVVDVRHTFEKGIEGQVDWDMAFKYAIEEL